jgi:hypothetical protein
MVRRLERAIKQAIKRTQEAVEPYGYHS